MRLSATLLGLASLATPALHAQTVSFQTINTGVITTRAYNNGILHGDCNTSATPWFTFNGVEGGCGSGFLLGLSSTNVIGDAYITTTATGWTPVSIGASTAFPYPTLTQGVRTVFTNAPNNLSVEANHYWGTNTPYVVHRYDITNTGATALTNVYPGMFWDWDLAGAAANTNLAFYSAPDRLIGVFHPTAPAALYFGTMAISAPVSGYRLTTPYPPAAGQRHAIADLWNGLTIQQGSHSAAADQRGVIGVGPYSIPAGGTITAVFASLGGTNQANLFANSEAARAAAPVAGEGGPEATSLVLRAPAPNPARSSALVRYALERAGDVRLEVFDVLGRRVATLAEGPRAPGEHAAAVATSALPAGTYVVRLEAGGERATQTLVVAR